MGMLALCLLSAVLTLVCVRAAWRLRRGDRVGSHRHCARCDFDLTGLGLDAGLGPNAGLVLDASPAPVAGRCPECGANLAAPGATEIGLARPDWAGIAFALLFAAAFLAGTYAAGSRADWQAARVRVWPSGWLVTEVERGTAQFATADELVRRIQSGSLTGATRERALAALCKVTAWPRPSVRAGDRLPFDESSMQVPSVPMRTESAPGPPAFKVYRRLARYRFGDGPWLEMDREWLTTPMIAVGRHTTRLPVPAAQPVGPTTVELAYEFRLVARDDDPMFLAAQYQANLAHRAADTTAAAWEQVIRAPVQITAAGAEDDVALVVDGKLRDAVRNSITFDELDQTSFRRPTDPPPARGLEIRRYMDEGRKPFVELRATVYAPPVDVAFDVYLRHPTTGVEYRVGSFAVAKGRRVHMVGGGEKLDAEGSAALLDWPDRATVVLRPSKARARASASVTAIWGEPIVFEDVTIWREWVERREWIERRRQPATTPTTRPR